MNYYNANIQTPAEVFERFATQIGVPKLLLGRGWEQFCQFSQYYSRTISTIKKKKRKKEKEGEGAR